MDGVKVGDRAPDFALQSQDGKTISLHEFLGSKSVVLYFYPKDFTVGCTAETRHFGENYEKLTGLGAEVIGISSDTSESHMKFASECNAKFPLLADAGGKVRRQYGVHSSFGLVPGRMTFIIDREGIVRHIFSSQMNPRKHVAEAIETLSATTR